MSAISIDTSGDGVEIWLDTEESEPDFHDGTIIGTGATFEDARDNAIETLRQHITELETKVDPGSLTVDDDEDEEEGDDGDN